MARKLCLNCILIRRPHVCFSFTVVTARDFLVGDAFSLKVGSLHALFITDLIMQYAVKAGKS